MGLGFAMGQKGAKAKGEKYEEQSLQATWKKRKSVIKIVF